MISRTFGYAVAIDHEPIYLVVMFPADDVVVGPRYRRHDS